MLTDARPSAFSVTVLPPVVLADARPPWCRLQMRPSDLSFDIRDDRHDRDLGLCCGCGVPCQALLARAAQQVQVPRGK